MNSEEKGGARRRDVTGTLPIRPSPKVKCTGKTGLKPLRPERPCKSPGSGMTPKRMNFQAASSGWNTKSGEKGLKQFKTGTTPVRPKLEPDGVRRTLMHKSGLTPLHANTEVKSVKKSKTPRSGLDPIRLVTEEPKLKSGFLPLRPQDNADMGSRMRSGLNPLKPPSGCDVGAVKLLSFGGSGASRRTSGLMPLRPGSPKKADTSSIADQGERRKSGLIPIRNSVVVASSKSRVSVGLRFGSRQVPDNSAQLLSIHEASEAEDTACANLSGIVPFNVTAADNSYEDLLVAQTRERKSTERRMSGIPKRIIGSTGAGRFSVLTHPRVSILKENPDRLNRPIPKEEVKVEQKVQNAESETPPQQSWQKRQKIEDELKVVTERYEQVKREKECLERQLQDILDEMGANGDGSSGRRSSESAERERMLFDQLGSPQFLPDLSLSVRGAASHTKDPTKIFNSYRRSCAFLKTPKPVQSGRSLPVADTPGDVTSRVFGQLNNLYDDDD